MSLWNSCDSTQETGLVKVCRKDNFEETGVQIEVAFSLANSHVVKGLLSSFWKLTELLFGMSVCQKRYPLSLLLSESFLAARLREAAMFGSLSPSFLWEQVQNHWLCSHWNDCF